MVLIEAGQRGDAERDEDLRRLPAADTQVDAAGTVRVAASVRPSGASAADPPQNEAEDARKRGGYVLETHPDGRVKTLHAEDAASVTDEQLPFLSQLPRVEELFLYQSPVSETGLSQLAGLTRLHDLCLSGSRIASDELESLAGMPALEELTLYDDRVCVNGLQQIARLTNLRQLDLTGAQITDTGLRHLVGLKRLNLTDCPVSAAGLQQLAAVLTECDIEPD